MTILQTLMPTQRMRRRKPPRELEGLLQSLQIGVSNGDSPRGSPGLLHVEWRKKCPEPI